MVKLYFVNESQSNSNLKADIDSVESSYKANLSIGSFIPKFEYKKCNYLYENVVLIMVNQCNGSFSTGIILNYYNPPKAILVNGFLKNITQVKSHISKLSFTFDSSFSILTNEYTATINNEGSTYQFTANLPGGGTYIAHFEYLTCNYGYEGGSIKLTVCVG